MSSETAGYREIEHTADWELYVWAPDFERLLIEAAHGMYALSQTRLAAASRQLRTFQLPLQDRESLLVAFLSELLFFGETEGIAFEAYQLDFSGTPLQVRAWGAPIATQEKEIKAVTYHRLQVRETANGLEVNLVFDV